MIFHSSAKALVCLIFAAFLSGCSRPCDTEISDSMDRNADESDIRSLVATNAAAANAGDPAGVVATFTPDGDGWVAGQARFSTHDDALRSAEEDFEGIPGFQSWDATIESIRFISADAAIVEVFAVTSLDTGSFDEETTIVVARGEEGWKIAAWRVMTFDETLLKMMKN